MMLIRMLEIAKLSGYMVPEYFTSESPSYDSYKSNHLWNFT